VVLLNESAKIVFVGDVLFSGGVGRTDFPRGNQQELMDSIKTQLWTMEDDVVVVSGHGPNTSIGHEKKTNPYVR
jgi:glyoxylase-like metal-dependent hydrolase (beta-lactamase superfamily II)